MLVDTNVLIWYLRGHNKAARFLEGLPILRLSADTYMELVQGCRNRQELERLKKSVIDDIYRTEVKRLGI